VVQNGGATPQLGAAAQVGRVARGHPAQLLLGAGPGQQDEHEDGADLNREEDHVDRSWRPMRILDL